MKRFLSLLLVCTVLLGMFPVVRAVQPEAEENLTEQSALLEITMEGTTACVNLAAQEDGLLAVAMYTERGMMIGLGLTSVSACSEPRDVSVPVTLWWSEPQYFEIRAFLMNQGFAPQCESLTCLRYTSAYEEFINKTTEDFPGQTVLQVTEETDNNFMVLSQGVMQLRAGENFEEMTVSEDGLLYQLSMADKTAKALQAGDRIVLTDSSGEVYSLKARSVEKVGQTVVIRAEEETTISDFMDYIKMDMILDIGEYLNQEDLPVSLLADPDNVVEKHFVMGGVYEITKDVSFECNLDGSSVTHFVFHYADEGFGETYQFEKVATELQASFDVEFVGSLDNDGLSGDEYEIPLAALPPIPLGASGATLDLGIGIVVSVRLECNVGFGTCAAYTATMIRDPNGKGQTYQSTKIDDTGFSAKAAAEGKVGIRMLFGLSFLKVAAVQVQPEFGICLQIQQDDTAGDPTLLPRHMCNLCFDGDFGPYGKIVFRGVIRTPKLTITLFELSGEVRQDMDAFYISYSSNHGLDFGLGDCTNFAYEVVINVLDDDTGTPLPEAVLDVCALTNVGFWDGTTGITLYLPGGDYLVEVKCSGYPDVEEEFTVTGNMTLNLSMSQEEDPDEPSTEESGHMHEACQNYAASIEGSNSLHRGHVTTYEIGAVIFSDTVKNEGDICLLGNSYRQHQSAITISMPWRQSYGQTDQEKINAIKYAAYEEKSQTEVGKFVYAAPNLKTVSIGSGYTTIRKGAFVDCGNLKKVTGLEKIQVIQSDAFLKTGLVKADVSGSVSVGSGAFQLCPNLTSVTLGSGDVGKYAFAGNPNLTSVSLGSISYLGMDAFKDCTSLGSISLPGTLSHMESGGFINCTSLQSVEFSEGLEYMGSNMFENCISLNHVILPDSLTYLQFDTFKNCTGLEFISVGTMNNLGFRTFQNCYSLERVEFRGSLTLLGHETFLNCQKLDKVELPEGLGTIEHQAFSGCTSLTEIHLPNTLTVIEQEAFKDCYALKDIYFGGTEEQWSAIAIADYGNDALNYANVHFAN